MLFFDSKQVKVFPCAYRGQINGTNKLYDPESRLNTEYNFTHLSVGNKDSYIIEWTNTADTKILKVIIHGYYFEIYDCAADFSDFYDSNNQPLKLYIKLNKKTLSESEQDGTRYTWVLDSLDQNTKGSLDSIAGKFVGLGRDTEPPSDMYSLQIAVYDSDSNTWKLNYNEFLPRLLSGMNSEGKAIRTIGDDSDQNEAIGMYSAAIGGSGNLASGVNAFVTGKSNIANGAYEAVVGRYNTNDGLSPLNTLFIVGNGAEAARSNAFEVLTDKINLKQPVNIFSNTVSTGDIVIKNNTAEKFKVDTNGNISNAGTLTTGGAVTISGVTLIKNTLKITDDTSVSPTTKAYISADGTISTTKDLSAYGKITFGNKLLKVNVDAYDNENLIHIFNTNNTTYGRININNNIKIFDTGYIINAGQTDLRDTLFVRNGDSSSATSSVAITNTGTITTTGTITSGGLVTANAGLTVASSKDLILEDRNGTSENLGLSITNENKVVAEDKSSDTAEATAINSLTLTYVNAIHANASGYIYYNSAQKAVFTTGTNQGQFKIGTANLTIKELGTTGSPSFSQVAANKLITTNTNGIEFKTDKSGTATSAKIIYDTADECFKFKI